MRLIAPRPVRTSLVLCLFSVAGVAAAPTCTREPEAYRGPGLSVAALPPDDVGRIYLAALGGAFSLDDPGLSILVDPLLLPRAAGLAGGDSMPAAVRSALRRYRFVKGTCQVQIERMRTPLVCRAARPGYVARFSAPFTLSAPRDSVQVHLVVQQYAVPGGPVPERLRFERAYRVARSGQSWRAISEARLPQP